MGKQRQKLASNGKAEARPTRTAWPTLEISPFVQVGPWHASTAVFKPDWAKCCESKVTGKAHPYSPMPPELAQLRAFPGLMPPFSSTP
jgi:hypothetical protein